VNSVENKPGLAVAAVDRTGGMPLTATIWQLTCL